MLAHKILPMIRVRFFGRRDLICCEALASSTLACIGTSVGTFDLNLRSYSDNAAPLPGSQNYAKQWPKTLKNSAKGHHFTFCLGSTYS